MQCLRRNSRLVTIFTSLRKWQRRSRSGTAPRPDASTSVDRPGGTPARSGTRLKMGFIKGPGGSRQSTSWSDTERWRRMFIRDARGLALDRRSPHRAEAARARRVQGQAVLMRWIRFRPSARARALLAG